MKTIQQILTERQGKGIDLSQYGEVVCELPKNQNEVYQVRRKQFRGHQLVDIRVWYDDPKTGASRPGKGVTIKVEALPEIIGSLQGILEKRGGHAY